MSFFSPLLIVCSDQEEANSLSELAKNLSYPDAHIVVGGFKAGIEALNARTTSPSYIIIDIGERAGDIFTELDEFALYCEPGVRVVVIGSVNDLSFYRELKARGVLEYFTRPVQSADIRPVLISGSSPQAVHAAPSAQGMVISCMSASAGDGASTLAMNIAYALAKEYKQPTVLVDMDYQFGLITKSLDLSAPFGIRELFDHPDRGLDTLLVNKMLVPYGEHLKIIAAPGELRLLPVIRPEVIRELVALLRTQFAFVVIDIPHVWTDWTAAALTYSDQAVMVAQLWLRSLTHAARLLGVWKNIGIPADAVSLVINRSGAKFKEAITAQDFERICYHKIEAYVNNDIKSVAFAENNGKTLFEIDQSGLLQQQIKQFAQSLAARRPGEDGLKSGLGGRNRKKLLALFDRRSGG